MLNAAVGKMFPRRNLGKMTNVTREFYDTRRPRMDAVIYIVGLIVIVMAILSFFGLR